MPRRPGGNTLSSDWESGYEQLPGRSSNYHVEKPTSRKWCLAFAIVGLLCAVSLIGLSEGWLEAMGLAAGIVHDKDCSSPTFTKETLKLLNEEPLQRLVNTKGTKGDDLMAKFEGSGIEPTPDREDYIVVFDNSFHLGKFGSEVAFHPHSPSRSTNKILPWPGKEPEEESEFEGITYNTTSGSYLIVQEAIKFKEGLFANIFEITIDQETDEVAVLDSCRCDFELTSDNKGFEGVDVLHHPNGKSYLLGLCEGNFCEGGKEGRKAGHGRVVIMEKTIDKHGDCVYAMVSLVPLPREANFVDYSDMAIYENNIAIVSQESSAIWVGKYEIVEETNGVMVISSGGVWDFPRNDVCQLKYCNVEGIAWEDSDKVVVVSDKMKSKGKQPFRCWEKDQSLHSFVINDATLADDKKSNEL